MNNSRGLIGSVLFNILSMIFDIFISEQNSTLMQFSGGSQENAKHTRNN